MHWAIILLMTAIGAFGLLLLKRQGICRGLPSTLFIVLLLVLALGSRLLVFHATNTDYEWFLGPWVDHFRDHGGFLGLGIPVGNYNVPYLYFLALFSYIPLPTLYLIKLLSVFFDVILAYYVMQTVRLFTKGTGRAFFAFFGILFLPTVFLNSAYWGQCESIWAAFAVMAFYYAMKDRPILSVAAIAVAVSFKLQAVFLLPLYLLFWQGKKVEFRHLFVFPAAYFLTILPALFFGRPLWDTLFFYIQRGANEGLNYNAPSIFAFHQGPNYNQTLATFGILAAFGLVLLVSLLVFFRRNKRQLSGETYFVAALLFSVGIPFFLPHMHDRYFYLADVFAVILGLSRLRYLPAIALTQFASLLGYHIFLGHFATPTLRIPFLNFPLYYGATALAILLFSLLLAIIRPPRERSVLQDYR